MKLLYISPTSAGVMKEHYTALCNEAAGDETEVTVTYLEYEPKVATLPLQPIYQEALFATIRDAERSGFDAAIVACYADPGVRDGRTVGRMPVFGALELGLHAGALLGKKMCILRPGRKEGKPGRPLSWHRDNIYSYCFRPEVVTYRQVFLDRPDPETVQKMMAAGDSAGVRDLVLTAHKSAISGEALSEAKAAIMEDGAEVIMLGCTLWGGMADYLEMLVGVPVVDPVLTMIPMAEAVVCMRTWARRH